jgi:hypothetical protein
MTPTPRRVVCLATCLLLFAVGARAHGPEELDPDQGRFDGIDEIVVTAARKPMTAASSREINVRDYLLRPHSTTQEVMNNVPGLLVVQHQGGGKAFQYFIRGFDSDHGTDFLLLTDGMPVNLVSQAHGQGWADSNYLIPETLEGIRLFKGPYFAEFGDFAVAGALALKTRDEFEENFVLAQGGSFDTARAVFGASTDLGGATVLASGEGYYTNGWFDEPQGFWRASGLLKVTLEPSIDHRLTLSGQIYAADWDASGQIPQRAVDAGEVGRFGTLDPSEGGRTNREILNLQYSFTPSETRRLDAQIWGQHYAMDLWSNFTFFRDTGLRFVERPDGSVLDTCADWTPDDPRCAPVAPSANYIPGDGIYQRDERLLYGGRITYGQEGELASIPWIGQVGFETRGDFIHLTLDRQVRRRNFFTVNSARVDEYSVGGFASAEFFPARWIRAQFGLRGDLFFFDVDDRLGVQRPDRNFVAVPIAGREHDGIVSPKLNVVLSPFEDDDTELYFNFGTGFHSNDARAVVRTGRDGVVRATGGETGVRGSWVEGLDLASALWILDLDDELVFSGDGGDVDAIVDPASGNFVPAGASRRWGVDFYGRYQLTDWAYLDYDLAWASPRLKEGGAIPLAPKLYMNGGLTFDHEGFGAALRFRSLGDRPANEDGSITAPGWTLFDILLRYRWENVEFSLAFLNVTDTDWDESAFAEATCLGGEAGAGQPCPIAGSLPRQKRFADGIDDLDFTAGMPFSVRGGVQVFF